METILIADDHQIVRRGVRMIVESISKKIDIVEAATCAEVIKVFSCQQVQYAVLDLSLADGNFFPVIQDTINFSHTKILVYSMNSEKIYARRLMQKGIRGFVSKQAPISELETAVQSLLKGDIYLSPHLKEDLLNPVKTASHTNPIDALSDRELEVVEYIATGVGSKEIASKMNLDITTVSTYRRRAFEKLDVQNPMELKEKFLLYKL
jgi:DNA-binding NarL/FixJ family response regulator